MRSIAPTLALLALAAVLTIWLVRLQLATRETFACGNINGQATHKWWPLYDKDAGVDRCYYEMSHGEEKCAASGGRTEALMTKQINITQRPGLDVTNCVYFDENDDTAYDPSILCGTKSCELLPPSELPWNADVPFDVDRTARWMWKTKTAHKGFPSGKCIAFKKAFKGLATQKVVVHFTVDNEGELYLNGSPLIQKRDGWKTVATASGVLVEGCNLVEVHARNNVDNTPAGLILAVLDEKSSAVLAHSDATWTLAHCGDAKAFECELEPDNVVTLYEHCDYGGGAVSRPVGRYDMSELGVGNDIISAVKVAPGYQVTVYEHMNFGGRSQTFTTDMPCLKTTPQGYWNDMVSSYVVSKVVGEVPKSDDISGSYSVKSGGVENWGTGTVTYDVSAGKGVNRAKPGGQGWWDEVTFVATGPNAFLNKGGRNETFVYDASAKTLTWNNDTNDVWTRAPSPSPTTIAPSPAPTAKSIYHNWSGIYAQQLRSDTRLALVITFDPDIGKGITFMAHNSFSWIGFIACKDGEPNNMYMSNYNIYSQRLPEDPAAPQHSYDKGTRRMTQIDNPKFGYDSTTEYASVPPSPALALDGTYAANDDSFVVSNYDGAGGAGEAKYVKSGGGSYAGKILGAPTVTLGFWAAPTSGANVFALVFKDQIRTHYLRYDPGTSAFTDAMTSTVWRKKG